MNEILQKRIEEAAEENVLEISPYITSDSANDSEVECAYKRAQETFIAGATFALQNQWILVDEDLPPYDKVVIGMDYMPELTWDDQTIIFVHRSNNPDVVTDKNKFCVYPPRFCKVTHWMPIPSLEGGEE